MGRRWRLPACYDASLAPDLDEVAARTNLKPAQVIERHSAVAYHVYMLGFLPGQAYMGDVAPELALPRRRIAAHEDPGRLARHRDDHDLDLPAGNAVRLASDRPFAGSVVGPGEARWRCCGRATRSSFAPVSLREYEDLLAKAADGRLSIAPCR